MRKSKLEAAQTREAIVAAAADLIRRTGIAEASLADMMAAAGLTHGGFYRHFRNKEHLVSEALATAGDKTIATIGRHIAKGGLNALVDSYLSKSHRDSPTPICPFAALGSEMARSGKETKAAATEVLEKLFATLAGDTPDREEARSAAIVVLSTMIGAMTLARVVADGDLSSEILDRVKDHLRREVRPRVLSARPQSKLAGGRHMQTNTTDQFQVEHIEYVSDRSFDEVVAALEKATGDVTDGKYGREIGSAKDKQDFEKRARRFEGDSGLMRFLSLNHGDFLTLMGFPAKVRQYAIGNPLLAATMLQHDVGAALNVPVRLVIYEGKDGRTRLGYDQPSSLMDRLGNPELSAAARKLDAKLAALAVRVTAA